MREVDLVREAKRAEEENRSILILSRVLVDTIDGPFPPPPSFLEDKTSVSGGDIYAIRSHDTRWSPTTFIASYT